MTQPAHCVTNVDKFLHALWFSVHTAATIGYGHQSPDPDCTLLNLMIMMQVLTGALMQAALLGLVYTRFSAPSSRATTIKFSKVLACYRGIDGYRRLAFRVANLRKHQVLQPQVHMMLLRKEYIEDDGGAEPLMVLPSTDLANEEILRAAFPHSAVAAAGGGGLGLGLGGVQNAVVVNSSSSSSSTAAIASRLSPYNTANQSEPYQHPTSSHPGSGHYSTLPPPPTSASFSSTPLHHSHHHNSPFSNKEKHSPMEYNYHDLPLRHISGHKTLWLGIPSIMVHKIDPGSPLWGVQKNDLENSEAEFIVLLDGIDESTSTVMQARHSYFSSDIVWDASFAGVLGRRPSGVLAADYSNFDMVRPSASGPLDNDKDHSSSGGGGKKHGSKSTKTAGSDHASTTTTSAAAAMTSYKKGESGKEPVEVVVLGDTVDMKESKLSNLRVSFRE